MRWKGAIRWCSAEGGREQGGKTCATTVRINSTAFLHTGKSERTNLHLRVARARVCARGGVCVCVCARAKEYVCGWDCFMRTSDKIASLMDANTCANYEKQLLSHVWEDYWSMLIWLKCINNFTLFLGGLCRMKCSCCQSSTHTRINKHTHRSIQMEFPLSVLPL